MLKYYRNNYFYLKICGPQIWLCLFMFRPIAWKQLYSLTLMDMFSCLGRREVTLQNGVREAPGLNHGSGKEVFVCFYVFLLLCDYLYFGPKIIIYINICNSFCNVNISWRLLMDVWLIFNCSSCWWHEIKTKLMLNALTMAFVCKYQRQP